LYKIVITAPTTVDVTLDWPTAEHDLGAYWFAADGTTEPAEGIAADDGGFGAKPETSTSALLPGTYLLAVVNFGADGAPASTPPFFSLTLSRP
jgi:hypothetical protein